MNDDDVSDEQKAKFFKTFGVSRQELRARGVDPDRYAQAHIHDALKDPKIAALLLPESQRLMSRQLKYGWRVYVSLFAGFVPLFVVASKPPGAVKAAMIAIAGCCLAVALSFFVVQVLFYRRYRDACFKEGIEAKSMWGRRLP